MYIIKLKEYNSIQIDEEELPLIVEALKTKAPMIFFKQGAIVPSQIICVLPDTERKKTQRTLISGPQPIPTLSDEFSTIRRPNLQQLN